MRRHVPFGSRRRFEPHLDLTSKRLQATRTTLVEALRGRVTAHHRFILKLHLTHVTALEQTVADLEARIGETLGLFRAAVSLLTTMPWGSDTAAAVIVAEVRDLAVEREVKKAA